MMMMAYQKRFLYMQQFSIVTVASMKKQVISDNTFLQIVAQVLYGTLSVQCALHDHNDDLSAWIFFVQVACTVF